jgi:hypothetical protein
MTLDPNTIEAIRLRIVLMIGQTKSEGRALKGIGDISAYNKTKAEAKYGYKILGLIQKMQQEAQ